MNGYIPYGQTQSYQATQYFPQPQGNIYLINNSLEVANIPMSAGLSVAICPSENIMYIKTLQGGAPSIMIYSIAPYETKTENTEEPQPDYGAQIAELRSQIENLIKKTKGGSFDGLV